MQELLADDAYPPGWSYDDQQSAYPNIRASLDDRYVEASDHEIEAYVAQLLPGATAEELEDFLKQLGRAIKKALPGVASGAASGAAVGTAVMPGKGTLVGAGLGAIGGGLAALLGGDPATPRPRPTGSGRTARPTMKRPASTPPRPGPARGTSQQSRAALQLLALLSDPRVVQALRSLALGAAGRREVAGPDGAAVPGEIVAELAELATLATEDDR